MSWDELGQQHWVAQPHSALLYLAAQLIFPAPRMLCRTGSGEERWGPGKIPSVPGANNIFGKQEGAAAVGGVDSSTPFPFPRVTCCNFCPSFEETEHPLPHPRFSSCKELNLFLFVLSSMLPYTCHFACVFLIVWTGEQIRVSEHLQWSLCHTHSLLFLPYSVRFKVKPI